MGPAISLMRFGYARPATLLSDFDHVADHISLGNSDSLHLNEQVEPYQQSQTKEISNRSIKRTFLRYVLKENKKKSGYPLPGTHLNFIRINTIY
jgi:hypothetical protein